MRIAYFLDIPAGLGGAGNVLLEQANIMQQFHDVIVVIPCKEDGTTNPEYKKRCDNAGLKNVSMFYRTTFAMQDIDMITAWKTMDSIRAFVLQQKIELLHSVQLNIAVELVARECGIPHLMNIYSVRKEEFAVQYMDIFPQYHSCDSMLYCKQWGESLPAESRCIRPAAPLEAKRKKCKSCRQEWKMLMLGSVYEWKNQMTAILAVQSCIARGIDIKLTIAGDDDSGYANKCRKYIEENGLLDCIYMIGFKSDVVPLLEGNDIYLCTSLRESFPSSMVEATTYDLTVISTPVAGVPELMQDKKNAYISKGFEVADIVDSIIECTESYMTGTIECIQENATATWKENFSRDVIHAQLEDYYAYMISEVQMEKPKKTVDLECRREIEEICCKIKQSGIEEDFVWQKSYYLNFLKKNLKSGKAYIWGAGKYGEIAKKLTEILYQNIEITAFVDTRKTGEYLGIPIIAQNEMKLNEVRYVFLAFAEGREDVIEFLENQGLQYNDRIWILP